MRVTETKLKGCILIEPDLFEDDRGYFIESFNQKKFETILDKSITFVQDNQSFSKRGVVRGAPLSNRGTRTGQIGQGFARYGP